MENSETSTTDTKTKWSLDMAHSFLDFSVKHMMINTAKGNFKDFSVTLETNGDNLEDGKVLVEVKTDSIETNQDQRTGHLKSPDFFDTANYPLVTFKSNSIEKSGTEGEYKVHGDLTIRDVTKPVTVEVEFNGIGKDPYGNTKAGFDIKSSINRTDFGLVWNVGLETGGVLVSPTVKIQGGIQMLKQVEA